MEKPIGTLRARVLSASGVKPRGGFFQAYELRECVARLALGREMHETSATSSFSADRRATWKDEPELAFHISDRTGSNLLVDLDYRLSDGMMQHIGSAALDFSGLLEKGGEWSGSVGVRRSSSGHPSAALDVKLSFEPGEGYVFPSPREAAPQESVAPAEGGRVAFRHLWETEDSLTATAEASPLATPRSEADASAGRPARAEPATPGAASELSLEEGDLAEPQPLDAAVEAEVTESADLTSSSGAKATEGSERPRRQPAARSGAAAEPGAGAMRSSADADDEASTSRSFQSVSLDSEPHRAASITHTVSRPLGQTAK
eukprot:tig00000093_g3518.t1